MLVAFKTYLKQQNTPLSDEQIRLIGAAAIAKTVQRKEILLQEGEVCRYKIFIAKGFLRTYRTGADGSEHVLQFSTELSWTTDGESYANRCPSAYNIDALEDSQLLMWSKDGFDALFDQIPALRTFSEQLISRNLHFSRNRLYKTISSTPAEMYEDFAKTYPGLLARVPLRMVASYLGVSVKTLNRIRQAQLPVK
ncbi:cyclic nucleotide-binding domain-containing protein [Larkinella terrae]|uniref:Cyclic nucleotide-binding domain-containing protein n=2 Tax=Larkinella terrae TaxID=2025311 RepID=A0A7K0EJ05_9BACT|nr:cyclic nucleotide-binding domain-containing protein [Larkinella terrae]